MLIALLRAVERLAMYNYRSFQERVSGYPMLGFAGACQKLHCWEDDSG
jgi:hypothetical protein